MWYAGRVRSAGRALLGIQPGDAHGVSVRRHQTAVCHILRVGPAVFVDRSGAPAVDVHLLDQHADFAAGYFVVSPLQHPHPRADRHPGVPGDSAPDGVGRRRREQPDAFRGLRRIPVSAAPLADGKRRIYFRPLGIPLRVVRLRIPGGVPLPSLGGYFVGRRGCGGGPVRSRRAHQGAGSGVAGSICPDRYLVESGFPAAQRARQLEAVRGAGSGSRRRRCALLEADSRRGYRGQRRLRR